MTKLFVPVCPRAMCSLLLLTAISPAASVTAGHAGKQPATGTSAPAPVSLPAPAPAPSVWLVGLEFATADDAEEFRELATRVEALPVPDARSVARAFLQERLNIDGDAYVVAHFPSAEARKNGTPDHTLSLSAALMGAFPEHARHSFFAEAADIVGGFNDIVMGSPRMVPEHEQRPSGGIGTAFENIGLSLWRQTNAGRLYAAFYEKGNLIDTVGEDRRPLDEAFGIYRTGGFGKAHASSLSLSQLVEAFKAPGTFDELPYVKKLTGALDAYWKANTLDWPLLARAQFVLRARLAREAGDLTQPQYELVMRGGAPRVPLDGPVSMAQLRSTARLGNVVARRFDINGYAATNLVRFIDQDGSEVMYMPGGEPSFVAARNEADLRQWALKQTESPATLDKLLARFSVYDGQDGVFWTGVRHGLEHLASGRWQADSGSIDHRNEIIAGDVFEHMRAATEARMRSDASMQVSTAWEGWRVTINRAATLLAPLGFVRPLVVPVQVILGVAQTGTGLEQAVDGKTLDERRSGLEQAGMTVVTNVAIGAAMGYAAGRRVENTPSSTPPRPPSFVPPQRVHGRIGYPMGPTRAPGFPTASVPRLYRNPEGDLVRWKPSMLVMHTFRAIPRQAAPLGSLGPGLFGRGEERFVALRGGRFARVMADENGHRLILKNNVAGPRIVKARDDFWDLALTDDNYVKGSVLAQRVDESYTVHPEALHRAAEILEQFGSSEADILTSGQGEPGPLALLALGEAIIETLPARLRYSHLVPWSEREVGLITPIMARTMNRALAFYGEDGGFRSAALADGTECLATQVPASAIRLRRFGDTYVAFDDYRPGMRHQARSVFQVAVSEWKSPRKGTAAIFRARLADALEARSTTPELEHVHRQWIGPLALPEGQRRMLEALSRLRHAVFDKRLLLSDSQVEQLREADNTLRETTLPAPSSSPLRFGNLMLKIATAAPFQPAEADYLTQLLASVADRHDALLPHGLRHLVVREPAAPAQSGTPVADQWSSGDRHYIRLRHLDGRTQVVETATAEGGEREILAPGEGAGRGTGRRLVERNGLWVPEERLREGFALMPSMEDAQPPAASANGFRLAGFMIDSIPQPLLRLFTTSLPSADLTPNGAVRLILRDPRWGRTLGFSIQRDIDGTPIAYATPGVVHPATVASGPRDAHLIMPVLDDVGGAGPAPAVQTTYLGLLHGERPISAYIEAGYADRHAKTLIETRRLRGMLREDTNMALVGATAEHTFTLVMPVTAETINLAASGIGAGSLVRDLPAGTVIVDPVYGVRASVADYPSRIRAVADLWEEGGVQVKRIGSDGRETRESPVTFTERLLASPVRLNLWNPERDPISEVRYVEYMHRRYTQGGHVRHAGLDWLETRNARRDYMSYFEPPYDVMPEWNTALPTDPSSVSRMQELAEVALEVGAMPFGPVGPFF